MTFYLAAYIFPAALLWGLLGLVLEPLRNVPMVLTFGMGIYALCFGLTETFSLPLRVPEIAWQVPARWVYRKSMVLKALIWGALLGPGLVTKNPYASMWLLPFLMVFDHQGVSTLMMSIALGVTHAGARAIGVLHNRSYLRDEACSHLLVLGARLRWRYLDGLVLLLLAGGISGSIFSQWS
jgi:hypothetical protein